MTSAKIYTGVRYRSVPNEKGEWFAVAITNNENVNFWYIAPGYTRLYTFYGVRGKYDNRTFWHEELCREVLKDLMSRKPSVRVMRFVVNGMVVFDESDSENAKNCRLPRDPVPLTEEEAVGVKAREQAYLEDMKMFEGPAPYIVYGKHRRSSKEYAWKLFPNRASRRYIKPGDLALVMTEHGQVRMKVTRVEEAGDKEQPAQYLISKVKPRRRVQKGLRQPTDGAEGAEEKKEGQE